MSNSRERIALNLNAVKEQSIKNFQVDLALIDDVEKAYDDASKLLSEAKTKAGLALNSFKIAQNKAEDGLEKTKALGIDPKMFSGRLQQIKMQIAIVSKMQ